MSTGENTGRPIAYALLCCCALLAAALQLRAGLGDAGIYHPDEIFQALEPAHRAAFGYGLRSWEWLEGARSWFFPGLLGGVIALASAMGGSDPMVYVGVVKMVLVGANIAAGVGIYSLARRLGAQPVAAVVAAALLWLTPLNTFLGHRALSDYASMVFVVWGMALALPAGSRRAARCLGVVYLCLSVFMRLQNVLLPIGLLVVFAARRDRAGLRDAALTMIVSALAYGALDALTWGVPFQSAWVYLTFNLGQGGAAAEFGGQAMGLGYYPRTLWATWGPAAALALLAAIAAGRRAAALWFIVGIYLLAHILIPLKVLRFVTPALPLLCAAAGVGLSSMLVRMQRARELRRAFLLAAALAIAGALAAHAWVVTPRLTLRDVGQAAHLGVPSEMSAVDLMGSVNRLLVEAGSQPDLCGIYVAGVGGAVIGGYTFLHREVPLYHGSNPPGSPAFVNFLIVPKQTAAPGVLVAEDGEFSLRKLGDKCVKDADFRPVVSRSSPTGASGEVSP